MAYQGKSNNFIDLLGGEEGIDEGLIDIGQVNRKGVYANFPASTPKYSTTNDDNSLQTQARLLIPFPDVTTYSAYLNSFRGFSSDVRNLAKSLAVTSQSSNTSLPTGYLDFLLVQAQENFEEKVQVVDVIGDNYVAYFFGQRPPLFSYQGMLMNTQQDDWRLAMILIYSNILRGTQLARRNAMVTLAYDKMAVTGALMNMGSSLSAETQMVGSFSFQLLVKRIDIERTINSKPTKVASLPYAVAPDTFSTQVIATTRSTMREIAQAQYTTQAAVKEEIPEETGPRIEGDIYPGTVISQTPAQQATVPQFNQENIYPVSQ